MNEIKFQIFWTVADFSKMQGLTKVSIWFLVIIVGSSQVSDVFQNIAVNAGLIQKPFSIQDSKIYMQAFM